MWRCLALSAFFLGTALSISGGAASDRFAAAGLEEPAVRQFLEALQAAVRRNDPSELANLIEFPLRVSSGAKSNYVRSKNQFLAEYPRIFDSAVKRQILAQRYEALFSNYQGVMIGDGVIWFSGVCDPDSPTGECKNQRIKIVTVNRPRDS